MTKHSLKSREQTRHRVPVLDRNGNVVGTVAQQATSVEASKVLGKPCEFEMMGGGWCWRDAVHP